jgi:hypothetical protein
MRRAEPYDPKYRNGWARGLIHFHTRFSDGWASIGRAAEIAAFHRFNFLVVTDHLCQMTTERGHTLERYVGVCDWAAKQVGLPVLPGGEVEVDWKCPTDGSQAHTLLPSVRPFVTSPAEPSPLAPWIEPNHQGTVSDLQTLLAQHDLPALAAHQFQHCLLSTSADKCSDYRYDLACLASSPYLDFFYSAAVELIHEPEDLALIGQYASPGTLKAVYAGCDFHVGPEATWPPIGDFVDRFRLTRQAYRWLFKRITSTALRFKGQPETAACAYFAKEQLRHATYVYLGDADCTEPNILEALRDGRTCVTRGTTGFAHFSPAPSFTQTYSSSTPLQLHLPDSYSDPRPRSVIVLRDGEVVRWQPYAIKAPAIEFTWQDKDPLPGAHAYQVYVPSKFLSSPIVFAN